MELKNKVYDYCMYRPRGENNAPDSMEIVTACNVIFLISPLIVKESAWAFCPFCGRNIATLAPDGRSVNVRLKSSLVG